MLSICLFVVGVAVVGLVLIIHASLAAPVAAEDERGFHLASPDEAGDLALVHTTLLTNADVVFFKH